MPRRPLPETRDLARRTVLAAIGMLPLYLAAQPGGQAGTRVEIIGADEWRFDEHIAPGAQRLKGNVRFRHGTALMYCDSAYLFSDQRVEAFGHVRVVQADSLHLHGDHLVYVGEDRIARMTGAVVLEDPSMRLETTAITHELRAHRAVYDQGAVVTARDGHVLISRHGVYHTGQRLFIFSREVRIDHPDRRITGDSVHYATPTGIAELIGPSTVLIKADSTVIHTLRGRYDTQQELARATARSTITNNGRSLAGDSLWYDRRQDMGRAWGHVVMHDPGDRSTGTGAYGQYNATAQRGYITGRAEMALDQDGDTLFLHADTIFTSVTAIHDSTGTPTHGRRMDAHRNVRFFKSDMQGVCDTLVHDAVDSVLHLYHRPALWSGTDQITGRHLRIRLRDGRAHRLHVDDDAFLMSMVDSTRFDQVAGRAMTGHFDADGLERILVEGNGRTIYHVREQKGGAEEMIGMNYAECSRILLRMDDGHISTVTFMDRPDAMLYPVDKVPADKRWIDGALWRGDERPADRAGIFHRPAAPTASPHAEGAPHGGIKAGTPLH